MAHDNMSTNGVRVRLALGLTAVAAYAVHVAYCAAVYHWSEALWACHVALLVLGIGLTLTRPALQAVGAYCLLIGTPAWMVNLLAGLELVPTSLLTHGGGWLLAIYCLRSNGVPRNVWWLTPCFLAGLQAFCRLTTPAERNINAAFAVYEPLRPYFSSYLAYELTLLIVVSALCWALELSLLRLFGAAMRSPSVVAEPCVVPRG